MRGWNEADERKRGASAAGSPARTSFEYGSSGIPSLSLPARSSRACSIAALAV